MSKLKNVVVLDEKMLKAIANGEKSSTIEKIIQVDL